MILFGIGSLTTGAIIWPLCRYQIPRIASIGIACVGAVCVVMYGFVVLSNALGS